MQTTDPCKPELHLAAALRREAARHEAGNYSEIGVEYDQTEVDTLPLRHIASQMFFFAFNFWDGWVDSSNHEWRHYAGIEKKDWPSLAIEVAEALETGKTMATPALLEHFMINSPRYTTVGLLKKLWGCVRGA